MRNIHLDIGLKKCLILYVGNSPLNIVENTKLDLSKFYLKCNKKKCITKLRGQKIESVRYKFCGNILFNSKIYTFKDAQDNDGYYKCGKHSLFLYPNNGRFCYKLFIFYTKANLEDIKVIYQCHNILAKHKIAPYSMGLVTVDIAISGQSRLIKNDSSYGKRVRNRIPEPGYGYGVKLKKLKPVAKLLTPEKKTKLSLSLQYRLKQVCKKQGLRRRGSIHNIMAEANKESNKVYLKKRCYLIDIDNRWSIKT